MAATTLCYFLSLKLGLATMDADHLGQNVASGPLALNAVEHGLQPSTASTLVRVEVSAQLHVKLQSLSFPKSCLPCLFWYDHLHMPQWVNLSDMYIELGIICWIIVVWLVVILRVKTKRASHLVMMLKTLCLISIFIYLVIYTLIEHLEAKSMVIGLFVSNFNFSKPFSFFFFIQWGILIILMLPF